MRAILPPLLLASASAACAPLSVISTPVSVGPHYASWNVDPSRDRLFFDTRWDDPQLVYLLSGIGQHAHLRFGGTGENYLHYEVAGAPKCPPSTATRECLNASTWRALGALASAAQAPLIFGLNLFPAFSPPPPGGPWNASNARALLADAAARGVPIGYVELGNEVNDIVTPQQQAAAYATLSSVLDDVYGAGSRARPLMVGPDTHSLHDAGESGKAILAYLAAFARSVPALHAVTHHEYIEITYSNVLNASFLDQSASIAAAVVAAVRAAAPAVEVWAGEIGPHNGGTTPNPNCASNRVCGRFGSAVWYADSLSAKAGAGYQQYCRQDVIGADYALLNASAPFFAPSADYYLLRLWHRLIAAPAAGGRVAVLAAATPSATLRAYAYCPAVAGAAPGAGGNATLLLINLDAAAAACVAVPAFAAAGAPLAVYALTPGDGGVESAVTRLNGAALALDGAGRLPDMAPAVVAQAGGIQLPPLSVSFVVVPLAQGAMPVCA